MAGILYSFLLHCLFLLDISCCSAALSSDSTERNGDPSFIRKETQGNSSFACTPSGPCVPCTYSEKSDDGKYHCSTSGYRRPYKCVEVQQGNSNGQTFKNHEKVHDQGQDQKSARKEVTKRVLDGGAEHAYLDKSSTQTSQEHLKEDDLRDGFNGKQGRKMFEAEEDGHRVYHMFRSCLPVDADDRLSVLGFEGIVLGLLAISAPLIYYRRKRSISISGMTRLPTNARF